MKPTLALALVALSTAAACTSAGRAAPPSYAPAPGYASTPVTVTTESTASTSTGYGGEGGGPAADVTARAPSDGYVDRAAPPPPSSGGAVNVTPAVRPGLATEWGESRRSPMSYGAFVRASSRPVDVAAIHYNDAHLAAMQAVTHNASRPWVGIHADGVRVSLRDEYGSPLPGYFAGDTVYVLGNAGQRYSIVIENATPQRFETVVSVDGLDVIRGRPASMGERGYILPAYGRVEIDGFRQSLDAVAAFRFGSVGDSYAAQQGDARNVGVIGVALFAERGAVLDLEQNELELRERANPFPNGFAPPPPARRWY